MQKYRWHKFVDSANKFLRSENTGLCKCGCIKTFGDLIEHFIIGGDDTFVMASKHGVVRIVGAARNTNLKYRTAEIRLRCLV